MGLGGTVILAYIRVTESAALGDGDGQSASDGICPVRATARILGARWTLQIVHHLRERRRFCELQNLVGGVNPTTLSQRLKFLEEEGLVDRFPLSDAPPHVEYALTRKGRDLLPILDALADWAEKWLPLASQGENGPAHPPQVAMTDTGD